MIEGPVGGTFDPVKRSVAALGTCLLLGVVGCGDGPAVEVAYTILPPERPAPVRPTVPPVPAPSPTVPVAPPETPASRVPDRPLPSSPAEPGVPIQVRVESEQPYEVLVRLVSEAGARVAEDQASKDGYGVSHRLFDVRPGRYRLQLLAYPMLEAFPLYDQVIELTARHPPSFQLGLLSVRLPEKGRHELLQGLDFQLREDPSDRPVYQGRLATLAMRTTFGDLLPGSLILPFGSYRLRLLDPVAGDQAHLTAADGTSVSRSDVYPFSLTASTPSVLLDCRKLMRFGIPSLHRPRSGDPFSGDPFNEEP